MPSTALSWKKKKRDDVAVNTAGEFGRWGRDGDDADNRKRNTVRDASSLTNRSMSSVPLRSESKTNKHTNTSAQFADITITLINTSWSAYASLLRIRLLRSLFSSPANPKAPWSAKIPLGIRKRRTVQNFLLRPTHACAV